MNVWQEAKVSDKNVVMTTVEGFMISFFREARDNSVWIFLCPPSSREFDIERPPVFWVGDGMKHDLALSKSMQEMEEKIDITAGLMHFAGDEHSMLARVWHGKESEGMGMIGEMLKGNMLNCQFYMSDYEVVRLSVPLNSPEVIKQVLRVR